MSSQLRQRVLTAVILIPLFVTATLTLSTSHFSLLVALVAVLGGWEWAGLAQWGSRVGRAGFALVVVAGLAVADRFLVRPAGLEVLLVAALAWWLTALAWVVRYQQGEDIAALGSPWVRATVGLLVLVPTWVSLVALHGVNPGGPRLVLFLFVLIWTADSAAYFIGRRWGARRLASAVSPGKSREGALAGVAAVAVLAVAVGPMLGFRQAFGFATLCVVTALASVLGDLTESLLKRRVGVKDSGTIVRGHGGVLDRIDSLTAAGPTFVVGLIAMGGF